MTAYDGTFRCPKCDGQHCGSTLKKDAAGDYQIVERQCHDEFAVGCRWRGLVPEMEAAIKEKIDASNARLNQPKPPIEGMKTMPAFINDADKPGMVSFWLACLVWAATDAEIVAGFERATGYRLGSLFSRGIDRLIDEATGHHREIVIAWADYVTTNFWGEEGKVPEDECDE